MKPHSNIAVREVSLNLTKIFKLFIVIELSQKSLKSSLRLCVEFSRIQIEESLADNPSLKPKVNEIFKKAYRLARLTASKETGFDLKVFLLDCPWNFEECMKDAGLPADEDTNSH